MNKFFKTAISGLALAAMSVGTVSAQCTNDVWNKVMSSGKIVIGVKADYKPWGFVMIAEILLAWRLIWQMSPPKWALRPNWFYNHLIACSS